MGDERGASRVVSVDDLVDVRYRAMDVDIDLARRVRDALDREGVCILDDFLRASALHGLQQHIRDVARDEAADGDARLVKGYIPDPVRRLATSPLLVAFVNLVLGASTGARSLARAPIVEGDLSPGINVMRRAGDEKRFHFDGTFVDRFMVSPAARLPLRRLFRSRTVEYVPGDLCMFYGYRTLHGVAPLDEDGLRCVFAINVNRPPAISRAAISRTRDQ